MGRKTFFLVLSSMQVQNLVRQVPWDLQAQELSSWVQCFSLRDLGEATSLPWCSGAMPTLRLSAGALYPWATGQSRCGLPIWTGGPIPWNLGRTSPIPWPVVGTATLMISGSPMGTFFPFLKGNRGVGGPGSLLNDVFLLYPHDYDLSPELCHSSPGFHQAIARPFSRKTPISDSCSRTCDGYPGWRTNSLAWTSRPAPSNGNVRQTTYWLYLF